MILDSADESLDGSGRAEEAGFVPQLLGQIEKAQNACYVHTLTQRST